MEKQEIRCSMLTSYQDCPRRAAASSFKKHVENVGFTLNQRGKGIGATLGTACHSGVEHSLTHKLNTGTAAPIKDCIDRSISEYETLRGDDEIVFDATTKTENEAKNQIIEIQKAHHVFIQPEIKPFLIEKRMFADLGDGFVLSGQPDLITTSSACRDLKTGAHESNYMAQLGGYSVLANSNGIKVKEISLDFIPRAPKGKPICPQSITYDLKIAEFTAFKTVQRIKSDFKEFSQTGNAHAFPANPMSMMCSNKFCTAHGTKFCEYTYKKPIKRSFINE